METIKGYKILKKIAVLFLLVSNSILYSQVKMEAYFGVSGRDDGSSDIMEMYDKGYYISGGYDIGNYIYNGWNIKTDVNLGYIYDEVLEHSTSTVATSCSTTDSYGNIYISGFMEPSTVWPFITKIDSCGNKVWCKILDYNHEWFEDGWTMDIILTKNNEIVLLTYLDSEDEIETIFLIGLSANGELLWKKGYASKNNYPWIREVVGYSIEEINNEYYISGSCYWPYPDDTTHFFLRPLFIGIDSLFNEKWILPFAPLDSVFGIAYKTIPINDSVFMGVGTRTIEYQGLLMFYKKNGEEIGYHGLNNDQLGSNINGNDIRDIARINDTLFITTSLFGPDNGGNPGGEFIVSLNGNIYGSNSRPGTHVPSMIKTYDGNFVIATSIEESKGDDDIYVYKIDENLNDVPFDPSPHTYDSLCPGGIQSGTIDLTSCFIWTDIGDAPSPKEYYSFIKTIPVKVYPNPVTQGTVTFEYENTEFHENIELRCFDVYGMEVFSETIYQYQGESVVNVDGWQKGMYFGVVYSDGKSVGRCKFVVQ